jgi:hypothetical protein
VQPHRIFSAEIQVAQATSSSSWGSLHNSTGPHCLHRAESLDSSALRYDPIDPATAQICVERIGQRRGRITLPYACDDTFFRSFPDGYRFYDSSGRVWCGASGGSSVGLPLWEPTQFATPHHGHYAVRPPAIDNWPTEALKETRALWASPECPPQWSPAGRGQGGDA